VYLPFIFPSACTCIRVRMYISGCEYAYLMRVKCFLVSTQTTPARLSASNSRSLGGGFPMTNFPMPNDILEKKFTFLIRMKHTRYVTIRE
jgi:hypothetical protein